jgi:hypothetical protein
MEGVFCGLIMGKKRSSWEGKEVRESLVCAEMVERLEGWWSATSAPAHRDGSNSKAGRRENTSQPAAALKQFFLSDAIFFSLT